LRRLGKKGERDAISPHILKGGRKTKKTGPATEKEGKGKGFYFILGQEGVERKEDRKWPSMVVETKRGEGGQIVLSYSFLCRGRRRKGGGKD